ncbi:hypothetical protein KEM55_000764 [Ascosphaera atra]|nr:hypothetical protein KEM55_000764 [Ascosphaera atra]
MRPIDLRDPLARRKPPYHHPAITAPRNNHIAVLSFPVRVDLQTQHGLRVAAQGRAAQMVPNANGGVATARDEVSADELQSVDALRVSFLWADEGVVWVGQQTWLAALVPPIVLEQVTGTVETVPIGED